MAVHVREKTIDDIKTKINEMNTALNKIGYLESALKQTGSSFEMKRFLWGELADLYEENAMFDKAAKAMANKAGIEIMVKDKVNSYVYAAELFSKAGRVEEADDMFFRATRDADPSKKASITLAKKNIYMVSAKNLESKGKKASAIKFYEKLIKMNLDEVEKSVIKDRLISTYKALGMFREAKLMEGM